MKFKQLKPEDIKLIKDTHSDNTLPWDERLRTLCDKFGVTQRSIRRWTSKLELTKPTAKDPKQLKDAKKKKFNKKSQFFIITWAQNDTPVHDLFFDNITAYANHLEAEIHVMAGRYKNPTSVFSDKNHDSWANRLTPYLDASRHNVHKYMSIMSDVKIQPTAVNPLSGMAAMSKENSCIYGHPKVQMETLPVLNGMHPKMMFTTGSCTVANYTDSKAGKKGEFYHELGFVVVEIKDKKRFFVRQVVADKKTGAFTDLHSYVSAGSIQKNEAVDALIMGDLHIGDHDQQVIDATDSIIADLKPKYIIAHDIQDGKSVNPHEQEDPFLRYKREISNDNDLEKEIEAMLDFLAKYEDQNVVIVRSNHDDFIDRYLKKQDWKKDIKNSLSYMKYAQLLLEDKAPKGVVPYLIEQRFPHFKTLGLNDSFRVNGWELSQHGHIGSNGSRGGIQQFRKLNTKMITGHTHSAQRKDGVVTVGTSTKLRVGYNNGASGWIHAHGLLHPDGKVQHIFFFDGEYTMLSAN